MSEMIERVAATLQDFDMGGLHYHMTPPMARAVAKIVIFAMREPPEDVAEALNELAANGNTNWRDYHAAMIDAALAEAPEETPA